MPFETHNIEHIVKLCLLQIKVLRNQSQDTAASHFLNCFSDNGDNILWEIHC